MRTATAQVSMYVREIRLGIPCSSMYLTVASDSVRRKGKLWLDCVNARLILAFVIRIWGNGHILPL